MKIIAGAICALGLAGCASRSSEITAAYVSPMTYQAYTCPQLAEEASRVSARAVAVTGNQDSKATTDAVATGVAIVVFWPAAFMIRGDGQSAAELAKLKGEMEAIERTSVQKKCGITFARPKDAGAS